MDTVGFLYRNIAHNEFLRAILQFGEVYHIPVIAISYDHLVDHYSGHPLIGERWNGSSIESVSAVLPQILDTQYNFFSQSHRKTLDNGFIEWLEKKISFILSQQSVNKAHLPQIMLQSELSQYLIPSWDITSYEQLLRHLAFVKDAVLKPIGGRKGKCVKRLYKKDDGAFVLYAQDGETILSEKTFSDYLTEVQTNRLGKKLLLQPCLDFSLNADHAVDFRLLRHRGNTGEWEEVATYARIGATSFVSNVAQGGYIADAKEILYEIAGEKTDNLYEEMLYIGKELPRLIQQYRGNLAYCLGIDIAIDRKTMRPFVLEANSYPGAKFHACQLAEKRVNYYAYLQTKLFNFQQ